MARTPPKKGDLITIHDEAKGIDIVGEVIELLTIQFIIHVDIPSELKGRHRFIFYSDPWEDYDPTPECHVCFQKKCNCQFD